MIASGAMGRLKPIGRKISNTVTGRRAEEFVVAHVHCPYCGRALASLPTATPVYDVTCIRCEFRAQVKSVETPPRSRIRGASARPLAGLRLAGKLSPPIIVFWGWNGIERTASSVSLFPLVPWAHIKERVLSPKHKAEAGHLMVDYHNLAELPRISLHE